MRYRHYLGYIEKDKYEELVKEAEKLEDSYEKTNLFQENATKIVELGKLYWKSQEPLVDVLYEHKTVDFSNDDTECFVIDDNKILLHISYAMQKIWVNAVTKYNDALDKLLKHQKLEDSDNDELLELKSLLENEISYCESAIKRENNGWEFPPFFNWQYNYEACKVYYLHEKFDYEGKVLVVYAY